MKYYEFIGKLELLDNFVVGTMKKVPYDLVVGIPCNDNKHFFPLYYISQELTSQTKDWQHIYDYVHALAKKNKELTQDRLDIWDNVNIINEGV